MNAKHCKNLRRLVRGGVSFVHLRRPERAAMADYTKVDAGFKTETLMLPGFTAPRPVLIPRSTIKLRPESGRAVYRSLKAACR